MKKLGLIAAALTLALLCAACATNAATPRNESSGEADAAELAAESANLQETAGADSQEVQWYEVKGLSEENSSKNVG